jgi:hypothetical protein
MACPCPVPLLLIDWLRENKRIQRAGTGAEDVA